MVAERSCSARIFLWWCFKILKVDRFNFKMLITLVLPIFKPKFLYDSGFHLTGRDSWFITRLNSLLPWTFSRQGKKSNKNINGYITVKYKYNVTKNITEIQIMWNWNMRIWIWKRSLFWNTLGIELCSFRSFILFDTFRVVLNRAVIWKILLLAFWCLVVTKRSHILEQNCGWNLQVGLSRCDLFVTTRH